VEDSVAFALKSPFPTFAEMPVAPLTDVLG